MDYDDNSQQINKNLVVFSSSPDFADNSRALYEYIKNNTELEGFWIIYSEYAFSILKKRGIPCALAHSAEATKMISQAKYLISCSLDFSYKKRKGQIHISLCHGFGPKKIGFFDSAIVNTKDFEDLKIMTNQCDFLTVLSPTQQLLLAGKLAMDPRKLLDTGFPRNDFLLNSNGKNELDKLFDDLNDSKLIIYLPTMRKGLKDEGVQFDENIFNYKDYDPDAIDAFLEHENAYIIAKLHFADFEKFSKGEFSLPKRMKFLGEDDLLNKEITLYHILNGFDCLITDYSSVYADFLLLDRPIIFSIPDKREYSKDRGFVANDPSFMLPGIQVESQQQLLSALQDALQGNDQAKSYREFMMPFFHTHLDGNSSQRAYDAMKKAAEKEPSDCDKLFSDLYVRKSSPLSKYTGRCIAQFFFDTGNWFNEDESLKIEYDLFDTNDDGYISFSVELPEASTGIIRFDPDVSTRMIIEDLSTSVNDVDVELIFPTGEIIKNQIYLRESDPQIVLKFDINKINATKSEIKTLNISFKPLDVATNGLELLIESQRQVGKLETTIKHSRYWKIKTLLRKFKGRNN